MTFEFFKACAVAHPDFNWKGYMCTNNGWSLEHVATKGQYGKPESMGAFFTARIIVQKTGMMCHAKTLGTKLGIYPALCFSEALPDLESPF